MKTSTTRRLQLSRGFSAVVFCSIAATHLAAAQNAPAGAAGPNSAAPPMTSPNEDATAGLAEWRSQMVDRITRSMAFPARAQCREGLVKISFLIDRAGNLIASEIAESSNVPAFDAEALAMVKRGHPYPPPPKGVGGPHVALTVPVRFRQQVASGERRFYLNLQADLTLTLNSALSLLLVALPGMLVPAVIIIVLAVVTALRVGSECARQYNHRSDESDS